MKKYCILFFVSIILLSVTAFAKMDENPDPIKYKLVLPQVKSIRNTSVPQKTNVPLAAKTAPKNLNLPVDYIYDREMAVGEEFSPTMVAVDSNGDVYVGGKDQSDYSGYPIKYIQRYASDGTPKYVYRKNKRLMMHDFSRGMTIGSENSLYFTDGNYTVRKMDKDGVMSRWGSPYQAGADYNNPDVFKYAAGITVNNGKVYVANLVDPEFACILKTFDLNGTFIKQSGTLMGDLFSIVAVDKNENIFLGSGHGVVKYNKNSQLLKSWQGVAGEEFDNIKGLAVDQYGYVYAADMSRNNIQKYDNNGNFVMKFGLDANLSYPRGVTVDSQGYVYAADAGNHRIVVFRPVYK